MQVKERKIYFWWMLWFVRTKEEIQSLSLCALHFVHFMCREWPLAEHERCFFVFLFSINSTANDNLNGLHGFHCSFILRTGRKRMKKNIYRCNLFVSISISLSNCTDLNWAVTENRKNTSIEWQSREKKNIFLCSYYNEIEQMYIYHDNRTFDEKKMKKKKNIVSEVLTRVVITLFIYISINSEINCDKQTVASIRYQNTNAVFYYEYCQKGSIFPSKLLLDKLSSGHNTSSIINRLTLTKLLITSSVFNQNKNKSGQLNTGTTVHRT